MADKIKKELIKKKRAEKAKARTKDQAVIQDLELDDEEVTETSEERSARLYEKAKRKMGFAPNMYRREDQSDMYRQAADLFGQLGDYEESGKMREICEARAAELWQLYLTETCDHAKEKLAEAKTLIQCRKVRDQLEMIAEDRDVSDLLAECRVLERKMEKKKTIKKAISIIIGVVVILVIAFAFYFIQRSIRLEMGL